MLLAWEIEIIDFPAIEHFIFLNINRALAVRRSNVSVSRCGSEIL